MELDLRIPPSAELWSELDELDESGESGESGEFDGASPLEGPRPLDIEVEPGHSLGSFRSLPLQVHREFCFID